MVVEISPFPFGNGDIDIFPGGQLADLECTGNFVLMNGDNKLHVFLSSRTWCGHVWDEFWTFEFRKAVVGLRWPADETSCRGWIGWSRWTELLGLVLYKLSAFVHPGGSANLRHQRHWRNISSSVKSQHKQQPSVWDEVFYCYFFKKIYCSCHVEHATKRHGPKLTFSKLNWVIRGCLSKPWVPYSKM